MEDDVGVDGGGNDDDDEDNDDDEKTRWSDQFKPERCRQKARWLPLRPVDPSSSRWGECKAEKDKDNKYFCGCTVEKIIMQVKMLIFLWVLGWNGDVTMYIFDNDVKIQLGLLLKQGSLYWWTNHGTKEWSFEDTSTQNFSNLSDFFSFAHTTNPSLRRQPYCDCKHPSISFCTRADIYGNYTPRQARSTRLGAGGVTGCKSYLLHPPSKILSPLWPPQPPPNPKGEESVQNLSNPPRLSKEGS